MPVRCDGRGSLGSASGGAVSTELIVRKGAGERLEETPPTFNKSSVLSLRTQPAEGTGELGRSAREVGSLQTVAGIPDHPFSLGVLSLAIGKF